MRVVTPAAALVAAPRIRAVTPAVGTRTPVVADIRLQRPAVTRVVAVTPIPAVITSPRVTARG
jgi:hypothetical protein